MTNIEAIMEQKGTPTLKAIAAVLEVPQQRIYSVAKQPKEGEIYDAKVYNWEAITRFVERRLNAEKGLATLEDVIDAALVKDVEFKANDGRHNRGSGTAGKIEVNGEMVAVRKYKNFEMESDVPVCLKKDSNVYKIVLQTVTHSVLRPIDENGEFCSETVKVISNLMLNMKGVGPSGIEEAIRLRRSGEFVVETKAKAEAEAAE